MCVSVSLCSILSVHGLCVKVPLLFLCLCVLVQLSSVVPPSHHLPVCCCDNRSPSYPSMVQNILPSDFVWNPKAADVEFTHHGNQENSAIIILTLIGCGISNSEGQMCNPFDYDFQPILDAFNFHNITIEVLIQSASGIGMPPPPSNFCVSSPGSFLFVFFL